MIIKVITICIYVIQVDLYFSFKGKNVCYGYKKNYKMEIFLFLFCLRNKSVSFNREILLRFMDLYLIYI